MDDAPILVTLLIVPPLLLAMLWFCWEFYTRFIPWWWHWCVVEFAKFLWAHL